MMLSQKVIRFRGSLHPTQHSAGKTKTCQIRAHIYGNMGSILERAMVLGRRIKRTTSGLWALEVIFSAGSAIGGYTFRGI